MRYGVAIVPNLGAFVIYEISKNLNLIFLRVLLNQYNIFSKSKIDI